MGLLTISFYILTNSFQRLAGTFSIHGGQPFLAASSFGIISTTLSCLISREIQEYVLPVGFYKSRLNPFYEKQNSDDVTRRACLGVGVFSLLEKKMFRTALPSSLLSVGVHATNARRLPATGIVATEKQRNLIQILGKQLGCHQCGSKQFFSENKQFIADHMPPTKFASEMNENFWRKTTNMEVSLYFYWMLHHFHDSYEIFSFLYLLSVVRSVILWTPWCSTPYWYLLYLFERKGCIPLIIDFKSLIWFQLHSDQSDSDH